MTRLIDRLLGRVSARDIGGVDSTYSTFMSMYGMPDAERIQASYVQYASEAYAGNAVIFSLVGKRLALFSEGRFKYRNLADKHLHGGPGLVKLEKPWPNGTTGELLARMEQDVSLAGNAYVRDAGDRLERLRPDWVTIVSKVTEDDNGRQVREVIGYLYEPVGDASRDFEVYTVDEVAHWSPIPDPLANFRGVSWLTPVLREIDADVRMTAFRDAFFRNSATPNIILKYQQKLGKDRLERLRDMMSARHEGAANAFKTMVLDEGADLTVVGSSMEGATFAELQAAGEARLAAAAGVPAGVAGLSASLASAKPAVLTEEMRTFADITMRPNWRTACAALAKFADVPADSELWIDTSDVAALRPGEKDAADTMAQQATTANTLIMAGFKPDSVKMAVSSGDFSLLEHSGLTSVQLYAPGTPGGNSSATPDNPPPDAGTQPGGGGDANPKAGDPAPSSGSRANWDPDFHPRDRRGRFISLGDLAGVELKHLSDHRLLDIFGQISGREHPDEAALQKLSDELERRDQAAAALRTPHPLEGIDLKQVSEDRLFSLWSEHAGRQDVVAPVIAEIDARRRAAQHSRPLVDWEHNGQDTLEQRRIDKLVASGYSYAEAYAEAYHLASDAVQRDERQSLVDLERRAGETRMQAVRRAYGEMVNLQYLAAENATRGHLLTPAGRSAGIDPVSLFSGQAARARKWASEDLRRWWADNPRVTFTEFSNEVLHGAAGRRKNQKAKLAGNGRDFGV